MSYFRRNIAEMDGYVPGFQPKDRHVVKLNTNENPFPPSPAVMEVIRGLEPETLRRYPHPLGDAFRQAAAEIHNVSPEAILCSNGGDDLLTLVFRAFCDEYRPVAYPIPTYTLYAVLARLQNCPAVEVPFTSGFGLPDKLANVGAALTIVCNPNAPTGSMIAPEVLERLAGDIEGVLLIDEAYVDFARTDCLDLARRRDNVIVLRSLSKGYSLAGLRFGYAVAHPDLICGLMKVKDSYNVDSVAIEAATAAIQDRDYFRGNVEKIVTEREALTRALRDLGFDVPDSQANFLLAHSPACPARTLHTLLAERSICIRYFNEPGLDDKLRISVGTREQNDLLLQAIREILSQKG